MEVLEEVGVELVGEAGVGEEPVVMRNSTAVAGQIQRTIVRGEVETDNDDEPFGFHAVEPGNRYVGPSQAEDYVVRIL